ncbi:hypothetical protein SASPL_122191 [Salvia splendens]|uniref:Pectin acetylesterase n=1 Tax=Salvia splendens TaxID=180675 RepID=A0A8X8XL47_SALSN|nr:hypothetical protein SASPL_122191 [Salvia splendens]
MLSLFPNNFHLYSQSYELWRKAVVSFICYMEKSCGFLYLLSYELWRKAVVSSICKAMSYGEKLWFPLFAKPLVMEKSCGFLYLLSYELWRKSMGGGWCDNIDDCQGKLNQSLGSSKFMPFTPSTDILSPDSQINPDFYNWNRIFVAYCDQSSFLGDTEFDGQGLKLQFRGSRIFDAVVDDVLAKGMGVGENALLSGISAGGLATILHCHGFRARLPDVGRVKCLSDGGFFFRG